MVRAVGSSGPQLNLLAVGSLVARKGYDVLLNALAMLRDQAWNLAIVGDPTRDSATAQALAERTRQLGLTGRVTFAGALSDEALGERYAAADLFVLASRFEGYGMAYAEAVARGLPVIGTTAGAIPGTVPAGAGLLVPPDDVAALSDALKLAITDHERRRRWSDASWAAARALPTWEDTARIFAHALRAAT
jgi:glycosyltransferase involved in cell wall biosynthesis